MAALLAFVVVVVPSLTMATPGAVVTIENETTSLDPLQGVIIGKVYELDHEKYQRHVDGLRRAGKNPNDPVNFLDWRDYLEELSDAVVAARQLESNQNFASAFSTTSGDYIIRPTPSGVFDFRLQLDEEEFDVEQRLDLNVDLNYIAELCFVVDRTDNRAWVIAGPDRRPADSPAWLPFACESPIRGCLAMLLGDDGGLPTGLLLLLAGSGATAATLGILATDEVEASTVVPQPPSQQ